jgi:LPXTG-motif cell wall-anchored protein
VAEVRIDFVDANAVRMNTTMISAGGGLYYVLLPSNIAPGTVRYHFTAVDAAGNMAVSTEYQLTVEAAVAPGDSTLLVVAGVLIAVALAATALLLLLRRRKKGGTSEGPGENGAA